jgi:FdhD protein
MEPADRIEALANARSGGRPAERLPVLRVRNGTAMRGDDLLAGEEPLEIRLESRAVAVTMRTPTPGQDAELAVGFLIGETIITPDQVARVSECRAPEGDGGVVDVRLWPGAVSEAGWQRNFFATSSCGVCGKGSIEAIRMATVPVIDGPIVESGVLAILPDALRSRQRVFDRTGGLHAAALFDAEGAISVVREDVGRHNAVDKAIGRAGLDGLLPLSQHILLVSGRASFEIVQKALVAGIPIVAAVSAPSTLAAQLARDSNMTLVGFLRDGSFNVYAGENRIAAV